ncbi:hypothetical protein D9M68_561520 [compost metagenome]
MRGELLQGEHARLRDVVAMQLVFPVARRDFFHGNLRRGLVGKYRIAARLHDPVDNDRQPYGLIGQCACDNMGAMSVHLCKCGGG